MSALSSWEPWPSDAGPSSTPQSLQVPASRSSVIERLTRILEVFSSSTDRVLLDDISNATGLPRSTTFRLLRQLIELGWVEHGSHGYALGTRLHAVAGRTRDHTPLRSASSLPLSNLQLATGGVAHLTVREGATVLYLDKVGGPASTSVGSQVGERMKAQACASGLALLSGLPHEEVDDLFPTARQSLVKGRPSLHEQLHRVRARRGLAFYTTQKDGAVITAVAAPVLGPSGPLGAISVAVARRAAPERLAPHVVLAVRATQRNAQRALGLITGLN